MSGHCILIVAIIGCVLFGHWLAAFIFTLIYLGTQ